MAVQVCDEHDLHSVSSNYEVCRKHFSGIEFHGSGFWVAFPNYGARSNRNRSYVSFALRRCRFQRIM